MTPQRLEALRALMAANAPLSAQALLERVKMAYPCVSLDTIYRNLQTLMTTGLVAQIHLQSKGIALYEYQGDRHHHHAVCLHCGKSFCVDSCPLPASLPAPEADLHFRIVSHAFEVYGYCTTCQTELGV